MNVWFAIAAGVSAFTCVLHVVLGGREAARPLLEDTNLSEVAKFTNYYCWHLVTIAIGALSAAFAVAATRGTASELAAFATGTACLFGLLSLGLIAKYKLHPLQFGQWILFLPISLLGLIGFIS